MSQAEVDLLKYINANPALPVVYVEVEPEVNVEEVDVVDTTEATEATEVKALDFHDSVQGTPVKQDENQENV